ncbi:MAG TPA: Hsp20/alpha crystallin family protein [Thermoleophilaceae bacterium]|jgi:HSP20 family protein|nr:Hsp20/alpha crystallin family protein [Thermoleophilaceae bacterium]
MAISFDPFRELEELRQQLVSGGRTPRSFPMDAYRRGDDFFVHLDLPGVNPDSIDVTVEGQTLTVTAERRFEQREGDQLLVSERPQGSFSRQLRLGASIDAESIAATYEDGVLTLTLPVAARAKPRRVEIRSGGEQQASES